MKNEELSEVAQSVLELIEHSGSIDKAKGFLDESDYEDFEKGLFELLRKRYLFLERR